MKKFTFLWCFLLGFTTLLSAQHLTTMEELELLQEQRSLATFQQSEASDSNELLNQPQTLTTSITDPEGVYSMASRSQNRDVMADIIPTAGATETFTPDVGDFFFDPGGPGGGSTDGLPGNYPNCGCVTNTTLAGVTELEFLDYEVFGTFDWLKLYDGADNTGVLLFDNSTGGNGANNFADLLAANGGSAVFTGTSGDFFFEFNATGVINRLGWEVEILATGTGGGGGGVCGTTELEINQDISDACMANLSQTDLAQSFIPLSDVSAGAGFRFETASNGEDLILSLWDNLPNAGGTELATGTTTTSGDLWVDVFWDPVTVTPGNTYYLVIEGTVTSCVSGSLNDPYPDGNVFANPGYQSFPAFDYTFRTYTCDITTTTSVIIDFEGPGEDKGAYASGTVNLSGFDFDMTEALIGSLANDFFNGTQSARFRGRDGSSMTMLEDKPNGLGTISFEYRQYGTDSDQQPWAVEYSTNAGTDWTQIGDPFTATADVQTFSETVNVEGDVRFRIVLTTTPGTTGNRRMNVDDIELTDFVVNPVFARVQVIHNSADPGAEFVDVYLDDVLLLEDFEFRTATPFVDVPADVPVSIDIAPAGSTSSGDSIYNLTATLDEGETYLVIATGVIDPSQFDASVNNPIDFRLEVYAGAREAATDPANTDVLVHHGATDAPTVDVVETSVPAGIIVDDISFPEFQGYLELLTGDYEVDVTTADGSVVVQSYFAPLATLGLDGSAITVLASGFLDPSANQDGASFGLWVALPAGGPLVELPSPIGCGDEFTDTGGAAGDYSNNEDVVWTIEPDNVDDFVTVIFTEFDVESNWDALYVFDGPDTSSPLISSGNPPTTSGFPAGGYYGTTIPGPFASTHPSGALTFQFLSDGSVTRPGWVADVVCAPVPPPNDLIENAISVTTEAQPYTDPEVRLQFATNELLNPDGCAIAGTPGVWYSFTAEIDGTAEASITDPAGTSFVIFYEAPSEDVDDETDLSFSPEPDNQCGPSTASNITTVAGQSYYIFVLNNGGPSDVVIDISGSLLSTIDNTIEGFTFYPNPTMDVLNLSSSTSIDTVELYNMLGQRVISLEIGATASQVNVSNLATGTYIMKVTAEGQTASYQVIKK